MVRSAGQHSRVNSLLALGSSQICSYDYVRIAQSTLMSTYSLFISFRKFDIKSI